jgi:hypothetical protein
MFAGSLFAHSSSTETLRSLLLHYGAQQIRAWLHDAGWMTSFQDSPSTEADFDPCACIIGRNRVFSDNLSLTHATSESIHDWPAHT